VTPQVFKPEKAEEAKASSSSQPEQQVVKPPPSIGELLKKVMPAFEDNLDALNKANPG